VFNFSGQQHEIAESMADVVAAILRLGRSVFGRRLDRLDKQLRVR